MNAFPINNIITNLNASGLIAVSGKDAEKFLQGQLTCDLREINRDHSRLGAYCNYQGRVLASFRLFYFQNNYYLALPKSMLSATLAQLKKYAVFSKVSITDASNTLGHIGFSGPEINTYLITAIHKLPEIIDNVITYENFIIVHTQGIYPRYEIIGELTALNNLSAQLNKNIISANTEQWRLLDILAGIANIYPETAELFVPHMLNYPELNAVSFDKGCYVGQEIIARMQYRGQSKRHLHQATLIATDTPQPGSTLMNENNKETGTVVDAVKVDNDKCQLLAVIKDEAASKILWNNLAVNVIN